ncbi:MAG: iron ABC transporter permease, partial [Oscillospiraceae bacterium]|nr:iron ABC transporter permease [Oscillospiraceae bacterium]
FAVLTGGGSATARIILYQVRLPRAAAAVLCGGALSVAGLLLQSALGNALASPGVMGINSGGGLFALISALIFPWSALSRTALAFAGAMCSALVVYFISKKAGVSRSTLILSGVAVSALMSAGVNIVITVYPETVADKTAFSLGGLQNVSMSQLVISAPVVVAAAVLAYLLCPGIDMFPLGDETAHGLGLNVKLYRLGAVMCSAMLSAAAVSVCGLMGFVGLIVPNLIRMAFPANGRWRVTYCLLFGGGFLLFCDTLSRLLFFPYELPTGLILSVLGAPFFIWMLTRRKRRLNL